MTERPSKGSVVLFRSPKEGEEDLYEKGLRAAGFLPFSLPVLDFSFINLDILSLYLTKSNDYSGIILTSPRAVEACSRALQMSSTDEEKRKICLTLTCYCVGPSTRQQASHVGFRPVDCDAGNAEKLAKYIIESKADIKSLLYPCGNLRRDTLSVKLKAERISLQEIVVYETVKCKTIREDIEKIIDLHGEPQYLVYFSPSGVQYTADLFDSGVLQLKNIKIIAIGSTTEGELKERKIEVAATAKTPDYTGVMEALLHASD